jgi:hypothetical protein
MNFVATMTFGLNPFTKTAEANNDWTQACKVGIVTVEVVEFHDANYDNGTQASADLLVKAS